MELNINNCHVLGSVQLAKLPTFSATQLDVIWGHLHKIYSELNDETASAACVCPKEFPRGG